MKIGPIEINRTAKAAAEPTPKGTAEVGASGTIVLNGFLQSDEYQPDLRGTQGLRKFRRMVDSDGSTQEAQEHIFAPIRNATFAIEPPENPDQDELVATAIAEAALFDWLDQPWSEHIENALEYLTYGHAVFELPLTVVEKELRVCVPGEYDVTPDGRKVERYKMLPAAQYLTLKKFAPRLQETIWRWHMQEGELQSIEQQAFKDGVWGNWEIEGDDLLVLTHKRRGDDLTGKSILRSAHKPWVMKEIIEKISLVAVERHGVGVNVGYLPRSQQADDAALTRLEDMLRDLRSGTRSYLAFSGPKAGTGPNGDEGYNFEIVSPTGGIPDFTPLLEYHRGEIKAAVLARFAELGHASVGARATGDIQSVVWFAALGAVGTYLCEKHQPIIERIVDANVKVSRYPKLTVSDIEVRNLAEFAEANARLVAAGAINPDAPYRAYVRKGINAPEEAEEQDEPGANQPNPNEPNPNPNVDNQGRPIEPEQQSGDPTPRSQ
jgi:hypothetical protein